jgi:hypothetical protein
MDEDLRRVVRVNVCCRVAARDRYGLWTAVTEDVCARGCRIVTPRLLRPGSPLTVTLSTDLFDEELDAAAEAMWATPTLLGILFVAPTPRRGALSPEAWIDKLVAHATVPGALPSRLAPSVARFASPPGPGAPGRLPSGARAPGTVLLLPLRRR